MLSQQGVATVSGLSNGQLRGELLSDQAYSLLRHAIVHHELKPGDRIVTAAVAGDLGVSQAPVREAIKRLILEGLVTHESRRGSYVTEVAANEAGQARQVRTALEELAARCACDTASEASLAAMASDVEAMRSAASADDLEEFRRHDIDFHRKVCEASGNVFLLRLWDVMEPTLRSLHAVSDPFFLGDWVVMAESHAHLLDVLRGDDPDKAAVAFARHASGNELVSATESWDIA